MGKKAVIKEDRILYTPSSLGLFPPTASPLPIPVPPALAVALPAPADPKSSANECKFVPSLAVALPKLSLTKCYVLCQ